jgi:hypothetical protein
MKRLLGISTLAGVATFLTSITGSCLAGAFLAAAMASSISAAIILLLGPVPRIFYRFKPLSSAIFLARGLTNFLSPEATEATVEV